MDNFSAKYINDNIYGGIGFSTLEFKIINTPTFQRLRRIKQQGLTSYTFPSSDHTRFSHSLGVLNVMGKLTKNLGLDSKEQAKLRLAALLHDIGHYPLSHLTERVYMNRDSLTSSVTSTDVSLPSSISPLAKKWQKNAVDANHESMGVEVLKRSIEIAELIDEGGFSVEEIGEIFTGETVNQLHRQLMHSSLDADRLDYILRDSAAAGVSYGLIDLDYLVRLVCTASERRFHDDGRTTTSEVMAVNEKGLHVLEHYLMARFFSYSQITMHRTTTAFESVAKSLIENLADQGKIYSCYKDIVEIMGTDEYLNFDDFFIWQKINETEFQDPYDIYKETLLKRNRIKILLEIKNIGVKETYPAPESVYRIIREKAFEDLGFFANCVGVPVTHMGYTEQQLDIDPSSSEIYKNERCYSEAPRLKTSKGVEFLTECSGSLLKELFDKEIKIFRIYYIDPFPKDSERSNNCKRMAQDKIMEKLNLREI
ncbi:MAG: HD domain-containing protein [Syntrophomonadaceae bacterium]|jgi:HD superfamily phosphohydrolase